MLEWGQLPPRNLPEPAVQWGRTVEVHTGAVKSALNAASSTIEGQNRSDAAVTADLARRIDKLAGAAEELGEAFNALPVTVHAAESETSVQSYGTWSNDVFVRFNVPEGKTRCNIIALGYERLWGWTTEEGGGSGGGGGGGPLPGSITVTDNYGGSFTLNSTMVQYASTVRRTAEGMGANRDAVIIAFMTIFVESVWKMYANSNVPDSLNYPHDAVGSDNDSLGLFQQRPSAGWGSVAELMDVAYNTRAFIGGPSGPNYPSPPGIFDIPGWEDMPKGVAAQTVQVSAFPERYAAWETGATELYNALAQSGNNTLSWPFVPQPSPNGDMPPVGDPNEDLAEYGPRNLTGAFHEGMDFGYRNATAGAPIVAAGPGTVHLNQAGFMGYGNAIIINHGTNTAGQTIYTLYGHRQAVAGPAVGQPVTAGQVIGNVGNSGASLGAHLHFEVHVVPPGGSLTWDYQNPSFESNRTAQNPRQYVGNTPIDPDPGGGGSGSALRIYSRVSIAGSASVQMHPKEDKDFQVLRPVWGRSFDVTPGQGITVALQSITNGGSNAKKTASTSQLTAIANFS